MKKYISFNNQLIGFNNELIFTVVIYIIKC